MGLAEEVRASTSVWLSVGIVLVAHPSYASLVCARLDGIRHHIALCKPGRARARVRSRRSSPDGANPKSTLSLEADSQGRNQAPA